MSLFTIDTDKCQQDGICAAACPMAIIQWNKHEYPAPTEDAADLCIQCGHCVAVCPHGALDHQAMSADSLPQVDPELAISSAAAEQFMRGRRSIRAYKAEPVERALLEKIVTIASHAPSGHNRQPVSWLVLDDKKDLKRLTGMVVDWMKIVIDKDPQVAADLHMERVVARWGEGLDPILRGAPALIVTHAPKEDRTAGTACTIALTYLELAAHAWKLGACWAGFFNAAASLYPPLAESLNLPKSNVAMGAMMVGKPRFAYHRLPARQAPRITWR